MAKNIFEEETITFWREGNVVKGTIETSGCCGCMSREEVAFSYIEICCESGMNYYVYDDEKAYDEFEKSFLSKRFTSYHEFFTTKELAVEERGSLRLKYYVRHNDDVYRFTALDVAREKLKDYPKEETKITVLGQYENEV